MARPANPGTEEKAVRKAEASRAAALPCLRRIDGPSGDLGRVVAPVEHRPLDARYPQLESEEQSVLHQLLHERLPQTLVKREKVVQLAAGV